MWTGMMAFVRGVMRSAILAGSMLYVFGSMSTKTGTALFWSTARAVARKVKAVVITWSPVPIPPAATAVCSAAVPLLVVRA